MGRSDIRTWRQAGKNWVGRPKKASASPFSLCCQRRAFAPDFHSVIWSMHVQNIYLVFRNNLYILLNLCSQPSVCLQKIYWFQWIRALLKKTDQAWSLKWIPTCLKLSFCFCLAATGLASFLSPCGNEMDIQKLNWLRNCFMNRCVFFVGEKDPGFFFPAVS